MGGRGGAHLAGVSKGLEKVMSTRNVLRERPRITAEHSLLEIDEVLSSTLE